MSQFMLNSTTSIIDIDVTKLPLKHQIKGSRGLGIFLIIFSSFWGGMPTFFLIQSIREGKFNPGILIALIFTIIGIGLFLFGLNQFFTKGQLSITSDKVTLSRSSLFGREEWREFLQGYEGILYRSEYHSGSKNSPSYTLYILEMQHKDPKKKVVLYQARLREGIREKWEAYSRALKLSALEKSEGKIVKRDVEDLDKSIQELVKEGKIKVDEVSMESPPEGIAVRSEQDLIRITITKKGLPFLAMIFMILFPLIFVYVGFFVKDAPFMFGVVGIIIEAICVAAIAWAYIATPQLRIGGQDVHFAYLTKWGEVLSTKLLRTSIEQVVIKSSSDNRNTNKGVVLESDRGMIKFGQGLPEDTLHWLKNCIIKSLS